MTTQQEALPRIMVVDDDPDLRRLVVIHLQQMKCEVLEAADGEEGLAAVLADKPDLILLDVMMPGLTGWEVAKYLRERPEFDDVGIIMVTAIGETVNDMTSPLYGADDHVDKPFSFAELEFKIRKTLSAKRRLKKTQTTSSSSARTIPTHLN